LLADSNPTGRSRWLIYAAHSAKSTPSAAREVLRNHGGDVTVTVVPGLEHDILLEPVALDALTMLVETLGGAATWPVKSFSFNARRGLILSDSSLGSCLARNLSPKLVCNFLTTRRRTRDNSPLQTDQHFLLAVRFAPP
jgi:hypothetical protein